MGWKASMSDADLDGGAGSCAGAEGVLVSLDPSVRFDSFMDAAACPGCH